MVETSYFRLSTSEFWASEFKCCFPFISWLDGRISIRAFASLGALDGLWHWGIDCGARLSATELRLAWCQWCCLRITWSTSLCSCFQAKVAPRQIPIPKNRAIDLSACNPIGWRLVLSRQIRSCTRRGATHWFSVCLRNPTGKQKNRWSTGITGQVLINAVTVHMGTSLHFSGYPTNQELESQTRMSEGLIPQSWDEKNFELTRFDGREMLTIRSKRGSVSSDQLMLECQLFGIQIVDVDFVVIWPSSWLNCKDAPLHVG